MTVLAFSYAATRPPVNRRQRLESGFTGYNIQVDDTPASGKPLTAAGRTPLHAYRRAVA
jgi:hypothetical protein